MVYLTWSDTNRAVQRLKIATSTCRSLKFHTCIKEEEGLHCTICVEKTKALISCSVTTQLICSFAFVYMYVPKAVFLIMRLIIIVHIVDIHVP